MRQLNNLSRREIENDNNNNILQFEKNPKNNKVLQRKVFDATVTVTGSEQRRFKCRKVECLFVKAAQS